jgi:hypothetical protein
MKIVEQNKITAVCEVASLFYITSVPIHPVKPGPHQQVRWLHRVLPAGDYYKILLFCRKYYKLLILNAFMVLEKVRKCVNDSGRHCRYRTVFQPQVYCSPSGGCGITARITMINPGIYVH